MKMRGAPPYLIRAVVVLLVILVISEAVVRLGGLVDYPIYEISSDYGYIPQANQSGAFLDRNHWVFNERHMAAGPYRPNAQENILLIGDSIVLGGNPVDQPDRLGSRLEKAGEGRWSVWPIGAASWSNLNEMAWIKKNPDVISQCRWIVWEINSGDFYEFSHWVNESMQPLHHPWSALSYGLHKYLWESHWAQKYIYWLKNPEDSQVYNANMAKTFPSFVEFMGMAKIKFPGTRFLILWYPARLELGNQAPGWQRLSGLIGEVCQKNQIELMDLSQCPDWNTSFYRDHMHPNARGNEVLAKLLSQKITSMEQSR